jgi:hypothetical protein
MTVVHESRRSTHRKIREVSDKVASLDSSVGQRIHEFKNYAPNYGAPQDLKRVRANH